MPPLVVLSLTAMTVVTGGKGLRTISARAGAADRVRIDEFTSSLRGMEMRVARLPPAGAVPEAPMGTTSESERLRQMFEMCRFALDAGLTDVLMIVLEQGGSGPVWTDLGHTIDHHTCSHHMNNPELIAGVRRSTAGSLSWSQGSSRPSTRSRG